MLVDDEDLIRRVGKRQLERMGYALILASDGAEAVDINKMNHPKINLVISDRSMPKMNGTEAYRQIKQINKHCKFVIASGYTKDENLSDLKAEGRFLKVNEAPDWV